MVKKIKIILVLILLMMASFALNLESALAMDTFVEKQLLDKSAYWQKRGKVQQARLALEKLLTLDKNNAKALSALASLEAKAGNEKLATVYLTRLKAAHPNFKMKPATNTLLAQARAAAARGSFGKSVGLYKRYFGKNEPKGKLALEYYQTAASLSHYWSFSRVGFERLVAESPNNEEYALVLAKHLTYRKRTRMQGVNMLKAQAFKVKKAEKVLSAWKRALLWLPVDEVNIPAYQSYLNKVGSDRKISSLIRKAKAPLKVKQSDLKRNKAFHELNEGSSKKAELLFSGLLKKHRNDVDVNGGLGVALLKQENFAGAEKYLARAIQLDGKGSKRWNEAYDSAVYWRLLQKAKSDVDSNRLDRAEKRLKKAILVLPKEAQGYVLLADVQTQRGDERGAMDTLERLRVVAPNNYAARLALTRLRVKNNSANATENALMLLEDYPGREGNSQLFMEAYAKDKNVSDNRGNLERRAQEALERNVIVNPENILARMDLAKMYRQSGQASKAMSLLAGLVRAYPEMIKPRYMLAQMNADAGQWDEAGLVMQGIPAEDMNDDMKGLAQKVLLKKKLEQALTFAKAGRDGEAEALLDSVDRAGMAGDIINLTALANAWSAIGRPLKAVGIGHQIIRAAPQGDYDSKILYTSILLAAHEDAEAEIWIKHLLDKKDAMSLEQQQSLNKMARGQAIYYSDQARLGQNFPEAWAYLEPYLDNDLTDASILLALARIYHDARRDQDALAIYESILRENPNDKDALEANVYSAIAVKDFKLAERLVQQGINLEPKNERFYVLLGRVERAQGHDSKALQAFQEAQKLQSLKSMQQNSTNQDSNIQRNKRRLQNPFLTSGVGSEAFLPNQYEESSSRVKNVVQPSLSKNRITSQQAFVNKPLYKLKANRFELHMDGEIYPRQRFARGKSNNLFTSARASRNVPRSLADAGAQKDSSLNKEIADMRASTSTVTSAGLDTHDRQGEPGLSQFTSIEVPMKMRFHPGGNKLALKLVPVILSAGSVNLADTNLARRFGSNDVRKAPPQTKQVRQRDVGIALHVDYELGPVTVDFGVSPLGLAVTNFVGGVKYHADIDELQLDLGLSRRSLTESFLAYAGTKDTASGKVWGGVVENTLFAEFNFTVPDGVGVYGKVEYDRITGKNVLSNNAYKLSAGGYTTFLQEQNAEAKAGVHLSLQAYTNNLQYYTFGHGGYFSPQQYVSVSFPVSYTNSSGALSYKLAGYLGLQMFQEDSVAFFPNDPALQAASRRSFDSATTTGFLMGIEAAGEYVLAPKLSIGGGIGFANAKNYNQLNLNAYLHYRFNGLTSLPAFSIEPLAGFFGKGS